MIPSRYRGTEKAQKEINAVLDDIRAEIMELDYDDYDGYEGTHISPMICRDSVMEIINKHKIGSEEE